MPALIAAARLLPAPGPSASSSRRIETHRCDVGRHLIEKRSRELRHELLTLRLQQTTGQLENPMRIRTLRKEVAKIETILTERRTKAATAAA